MTPDVDIAALGRRLDSMPGVDRLREAARATGADAYLVGGAVRDLLLGLERGDADVVVVGDERAFVDALGGEARAHERFGTAAVTVEGREVDVASARRETYARPGALPEVAPGDLADDLARRDFTVNAIAVPLAGDEPIDPHGGLADLREGRLRALSARSFVDDPTRALRAARYAARLGLEVDPETLATLREAKLETVSADRVESELRRLAVEPDPVAGLGLLVDWGLATADLGLAAGALAVLASPGWGSVAARADAFLAASAVEAGAFAAQAPLDAARRLVEVLPERPSVCVHEARGHTGIELVIARALGAAWLDDYVRAWRDLRLEISGDDLLAAGIDEGPALGRGLEAALAAKLDGEVHGRDEELRVALTAARGSERL